MPLKSFPFSILCAAALGLLAAPRIHATNVVMQHNDFSRDGANLSETLLTPVNVNAAHFGKLYTRNVDGSVFAQPLYVAGLTIAGQTHNVVFVATEHDSVYAFDADDPAAANPLWQVNLGPSVPRGDVNNCSDLVPEIGISGTPTIDLGTGTLYVDAKTKETNGVTTVYVHRLHALDITSGAEKFGGPVVIQGIVNGITFDPLHHHQRSGLLLLSNVVYLAFGSHCDWKPYNGWLFGYNATNLSQVSIFNVTPGSASGEGAIWSCGMAPAVDTNGNIYVMTGNGNFDATSGTNYGQCVIKFTTTNGLAVADWFSPYNEGTLSGNDRDLGSGGPVLLPGTHLIMGICKNGTNYLMDQNHLGHQSANGTSDTNIVQEFLATTPVDRIGQSPVCWTGPTGQLLIFLSCGNSNTLAYAFNGTTISTTPLAISAAKQGSSPGGISLSANGTNNGILWVIYNIGSGLLYAYNATNLPTPLWSSTNNAARDAFSGFVKFVSPTIADGKVFVPGTNTLVVYGLLSASTSTLLWTAGSGVDTNWTTALNWTNTTIGGNGAPGPANDVQFDNTAAVSSVAAPDNVVNNSTTIASLLYANNAPSTSPNYHVALVAPGRTLTITNGLTIGTGGDAGANQVVNAVAEGAGGALNVSGGNLFIAQGSSTAGAAQATLDLSGLDTFTASVNQLFIGTQLSVNAARTRGVLFLAKTNAILVNSTGPTNSFLVGWNNSNGTTNGLAVYLGETNSILADTINIGAWKQNGCLLAFNPNGLINPSARFRNKDGVSRVTSWTISDASQGTSATGQSVSATNDFSGGAIDALISGMSIGATVQQTANSPGAPSSGTLTFDTGIVDVNNLTNGWTGAGGSNPSIGSGIVNVNGSGTLKINNTLVLALKTGTNNSALSIPTGTMNVIGGTLFVNTVIAGNGISSFALNGGTVVASNRIGTPGAGLSTFATANAFVHLRLDGNAIITNIVATNLTANGMTTLSIDSVSNVATTITFPLISYGSLSGSIANFTLGGLPGNFAGALTNNTTVKRIDLVLTHAPANPIIGSIGLSGPNLVLSGTNGAHSWTYYLLTSTNVSLPLSNWSAVQTGFFDGSGNFQLTNSTDPAAARQFYILQMP